MKFDDLKLDVKGLCAKYAVNSLEIAGSFARGDAKESSDIDLIIEFNGNEKLFDRYMDFMSEVSSITGRKVDLISYPNIRNPVLRRSLDRDRRKIYG